MMTAADHSHKSVTTGQAAAGSEHATGQSTEQSTGELVGVIAQFNEPQALVAACNEVRQAGYRRWDAHSPFPIHGIDDAIGIKPTRLPWITLSFALLGLLTAQAMQYYMNVYDYKFMISGKPTWSIPSSMPVTFELAVLMAAYSTGLGMLLINGLPRWANPLLRSDRFARVTNDKFFIHIDGRDPLFRGGRTANWLASLGATQTEEIRVSNADRQIPTLLWSAGAILLALLLVPPAMIYKLRVTGSRVPRIHLIHDMDHQPKFKTQKSNALFADGRASRPQVFGTVARGHLQADDKLYRGLLDSAPLMALVSMPQTDSASAASPTAAAPATTTDPAAPPAAPVDPLDSLPWVTQFPVPVSEATMRRGQERYNVYCSSCHGLAGDGDGLVTLRALELDQGTWIKPVSYHSDQVRNQPIGRLFHSITNGVRKMPAMGDVIPTEDRWAILLYLRALQRARQGTLNDVPVDRLEALQAS